MMNVGFWMMNGGGGEMVLLAEVFERDNDQIEWYRHAGNFDKICGACVKKCEAGFFVLPCVRMGGQRRVGGAAQKCFDVGRGWKVAEQGFLFDEDRQSVTTCLK